MTLPNKFMRVIPIKFFADNYCYAVFNKAKPVLSLVDPADFQAVSSFVNSQLPNLTLSYVFSTHKHYDHSRDNLKIKELHPQVEIFGGENDNIPGVTTQVKDNQKLSLSNGLEVRVLYTPCHTQGHVMFYFEGEPSVLFTGDTLFVGGCGKFFEGNAEDMHNSLEKVKQLRGDTQIYCGHEYTLSNLEWAAKVDTDNEYLMEKLKWVRQRRSKELETVPSTVEEEMKTNPFMRAEKLAPALGVDGPIEAIAKLRYMKNNAQTLIP